MFLAERLHNTSASGLRHALANLFVKLVIRILGPSVEQKMQSEQSGNCLIRGWRQEDAAGIARPHAISAPAMKENTIRESARFLEHHARSLFPTRVIDDQVHTLVPCQVADDLGIDPWDRIELARPVGAKMRPRKPGRVVRLALGGHAVSLCGGA